MQLVQGWNLTYKQYEGAQDGNQSANVGWHTSFLDRPPFCHDCRMQCTLQTPVSMSKSPKPSEIPLWMTAMKSWRAQHGLSYRIYKYLDILQFFTTLISHLWELWFHQSDFYQFKLRSKLNFIPLHWITGIFGCWFFFTIIELQYNQN